MRGIDADPPADVMPRVIINGLEVDAAAGRTLLDVARDLGVEIPTLCHLPGRKPHTSCMVCVVRDRATEAFLPACSAPVRDGMVIVTDSPEVLEARRVALELLLSDHPADCEGPCRRFCPAGMEIPRMIRQIAAGDFDAALQTVKRDIPLPATLGRICPAPCERGCRRREADAAVSICRLKRFVADTDLSRAAPFRPATAPPSGRTVFIAGAGPAGISAAYYLAVRGHRCIVADPQPEPGGALRTHLSAERLPPEIVTAEVRALRDLGVEFWTGVALGRDVELADALRGYDAVVLAIGPRERRVDPGAGMPAETARGIAVDRETHRTGVERVFACGAAVAPCRMAIRAVAEGKTVARAVDALLRGGSPGTARRFNSRLGRLEEGEWADFRAGAAMRARVEPAGGAGAGFSAAEARAEAERCLHCDCRKREECRLRLFAERYGAHQNRFSGERRRAVRIVRDHADILYEPAKCISCGICVRIAEEHREELGLTFIGRGFDVRVETPFGESLAKGLYRAALACAEACPTGALCRREEPTGKSAAESEVES